jgi:hypothetical protein
MNRIALLLVVLLAGCSTLPPRENIADDPARLRPYVGTWASAPSARPSVLFKIELVDLDLKLTRYIYTDAQGVSHDLSDQTTLTRSDRDVVLAGKGPLGNDFSIVLSQPGSRSIEGTVTSLGTSFPVRYWKQ